MLFSKREGVYGGLVVFGIYATVIAVVGTVVWAIWPWVAGLIDSDYAMSWWIAILFPSILCIMPMIWALVVMIISMGRK